MIDSNAQHFAVWKAFNHKVYQKTLTHEHLGGSSEKYVDTVFEVSKDSNGKYLVKEDKIIETKCVFMEKGGKKYILPSEYIKHMPLNPKKTFDCYLSKSDKTIYKFIEVPTSCRITPIKVLSFKQLVTVFNPMLHSDPKTWEFLRIQAISVKHKGGKYRLCSPPATGKSSNATILHCITNDTVRVSKPTLAKLETLFYYNQTILPDEMTSLTPSQVRDIEPFFLTIADESPTFTKHSMAMKHDMNEVDISQSSCIFTYNDPASLGTDSKFFDDIWQNKEAFNSRYPALLLSGEVLSEMPKLSNKQAVQIMEDNYEYLAQIAKNLVYYFENLSSEIHGWDRSKLRMSGRHKANFEAVIDGLDAYSESQDEFDEWIDWVNQRVLDYKRMLDSQGFSARVVSEEVLG